VIRPALLLAAVVSLPASDFLHVPLACKYPQESHAIAGALVSAAVNYALPEDTRFVPRLVASTAAALAVGTLKETCVDKHARWNEVPAWGIGAAAVSMAWSWSW
jgi:hypothetical protein